jgi:hypothetical protein
VRSAKPLDQEHRYNVTLLVEGDEWPLSAESAIDSDLLGTSVPQVDTDNEGRTRNL